MSLEGGRGGREGGREGKGAREGRAGQGRAGQGRAGREGGRDIHPEFILHLHNSATNWLRLFLSACLTFQAIPKIWRKAKVIGILKPNKPAEQPKSYRTISLLCIPFKLMERLILNRIKHTVEAYTFHMNKPDLERAEALLTK